MGCPPEPPRFPLIKPDVEIGDGTDLHFKLAKGVVVQVRSKEELGVDEIEKLLKLLEAQRDVLAE